MQYSTDHFCCQHPESWCFGSRLCCNRSRLRELEKRLQQAQEVLNKINYKIDLGYYANFRAALDLAVNAFTMGI
jgi:hypothetical protein